MDKELIERWAREAGAQFDHMTWVERDLAPVFQRFAELVAAHERERVIQAATKLAESKANELIDLEREQCAKLVEDWDSDSADPREVAAAIRARG